MIRKERGESSRDGAVDKKMNGSFVENCYFVFGKIDLFANFQFLTGSFSREATLFEQKYLKNDMLKKKKHVFVSKM